MTMHSCVNGQLRTLVGATAYLAVVALFIATARWMLPLSFWVLMALGGAAHIAGRWVFDRLRNQRYRDDFIG